MSGNDHIKSAYGVVLLAAGKSSRLGKPKQLLLYKGKTLLQHGLHVALAAGAKPIVAVLGAGADQLMKEINGQDFVVTINKEWQEGMGSSIRCGLQKLLEVSPTLDSVIFMVCDQPFVTVQLLHDLVAKYRLTAKPIIASTYENSVGTPALFDKTIFTQLLELKGDAGAKKIIKENPDMVDVVNFPLGYIDIDTDADYEALQSSYLTSERSKAEIKILLQKRD